MRVTTGMLTANMAVNLFKQSEQRFRIQKKIATGKEINTISDDPAGMAKVHDYRKTIASLEQYKQNVTAGKMRLEISETILDEASSLLKDAVNIAVDASAGTLDTRPIAADHIKNIHEQLQQMANSKLGNDYLYAGHQTDKAPFAHLFEISGGTVGDIVFGLAAEATDTVIDIQDATGTVLRRLTLGDGITPGSGGSAGVNTIGWDGLDSSGVPISDGIYQFTVTSSDAGTEIVNYETYNGDNGDIRMILGDNLSMVINADGRETFSDLFYQISRLRQGLQNPDEQTGSAQISATLDPLYAASDRLQHVRAEGAVKFKRLELTENQYANVRLKVEDMLADTENTDIARAILELQNLETAYETTLATAARTLQPSLINYLG